MVSKVPNFHLIKAWKRIQAFFSQVLDGASLTGLHNPLLPVYGMHLLVHEPQQFFFMISFHLCSIFCFPLCHNNTQRVLYTAHTHTARRGAIRPFWITCLLTWTNSRAQHNTILKTREMKRHAKSRAFLHIFPRCHRAFSWGERGEVIEAVNLTTITEVLRKNCDSSYWFSKTRQLQRSRCCHKKAVTVNSSAAPLTI